jgi:multisubunit Na+/H+ antiporter MnhB subunit
MTLELLLDLVLVAALVGVAARAIHAPALFTAVVLYIAFGLLLALVWVRLNAPDLALAEAAIGAGVTGALLLDAAGQLGAGDRRPPRRRRAVWMVSGGVLAFVGVTAFGAVSLADRSPALSGLVRDRLEQSGVTNSVTAVLLNFRGYDTWLEVGVLLAAGIGLLALAAGQDPLKQRRGEPIPSRAALASGSLLVPLAVLVGGYLLWRGTHEPGGAFQAGAVVAAAGILLILAGARVRPPFDSAGRRLLLATGFLSFLLAGMAGWLVNGTFLDLPSAAAGTIILLVELGIMISTATTLVLLFAGARPPGGVRPERANP